MADPGMGGRTLREALIASVNGYDVTPDEAWALVKRWQELTDHYVGCPNAQQEADPNCGRVHA